MTGVIIVKGGAVVYVRNCGDYVVIDLDVMVDGVCPGCNIEITTAGMNEFYCKHCGINWASDPGWDDLVEQFGV